VTRAAPAIAALAAALAGCAASPPLADGLPAAAPRSIELDGTPFFPQEEYQCGPAALATILAASGVPLDAKTLEPEVFIPGRRGSLELELKGAARRHGRIPYELATTAHELVAELEEGRPVLVLQNLGASRLPVWHYAVLIGYDAEKNVAILRSGRDERVEMRWQRFAGTWHRAGRFALTALVPGEIPVHAEASRYVEAAAGLEAAGQWKLAGESYDAAIARWPSEPRAWLGRGNVAYAGGDLAAAADAYGRAIQLAPNDAAARNNLAQALADAACPDAARRQAERAAQLAAGTALEGTAAETRARIEAAPAAGECALAGRAWPD
jgi:tetratricopeptide (TPR) repeat protein